MKQRKMDYHLHTNHSMDGKQSVDALCKRAVALGLEEIGITDHIDPGHPSPGVDVTPVFDVWHKEIGLAKEAYPGLTIRVGLEIGDNMACRQQIYDIVDGQPLDFRLFSLHLIDGCDPYDDVYFGGKTQAQAYRQYVERRVESVTTFRDYDAIAHLGYVCKFAPYPRETRPIQYHHAPDAFDAIFKYLAQEGKALEINTSGLVNTDEPIPGPGIVKRYLELGGEFFTFGSDAHYEERVGIYLDKCREMVRSLGGKWQAGFHNRVMEVHKI